MSQKIAFAAQLVGIKSKADRTYKIEFNTQELGEDGAKLFAMLMNQGWIVFSPNDDITDSDVPEVKADAGLGNKTPSSRLRAVLRIYWEQKGKPGDWEDFYVKKMERLIDSVKEKLNDE